MCVIYYRIYYQYPTSFLGSSASPPGKKSPSHWAKGVLIFGLEVQAVGRTHLENHPTKVSYQRRVSYDLVNDTRGDHLSRNRWKFTVFFRCKNLFVATHSK